MITSLEHVAIVADDPRALADWYCTALGCEIAIADETYSTYFVAVPGTGVLEILPSSDRPRMEAEGDDAGIRHIAFTVADFEEACQHIKEQGIELLQPISVSSTGTKLAFFPDLEGNILQFVYRPKPLR